MAGKIFINYRRDDSASHALNIAQSLENKFGKSNIFIDIDRLRAGQEFETVLENKLRQCKVMLAIIGPNWVDARDGGSRRIDNPEDWVRLEIERALARKIPVIPVLVAGATLPSKSDLPPSLQPLLKHQGATLTTNGFRYEMAGLARDVADLTVRRPWGRMAAAASALILCSYVVAHQFGVPVWWPPPGLGQVNLPEEPPKPSAKGERDSAAAEAAEADKRKALVAQKVVLYEEDPDNPAGKRYVGSAVWRTEAVPPAPGQAPDLAIRADIEIPEQKISARWSLRRNDDKALPASHTVEVLFTLPPDFPHGGITNIPGVLMKQSESTRGVPLAGLAVKVTNNFFLIGLSSVEGDRARNIQLLKERAWFDIPVVYNDGRRAIIAIEKGTPGERAFARAFEAWGQ